MQTVLYIVLFLLILFISLKKCVESYSVNHRYSDGALCEGAGLNYLDRHPVDCGSNLINRWDFQSVPDRVDGKCRSYIKCVEGTKQRHSTINMKTDKKGTVGHYAGDLDKGFNLECGDMPIKYFRLGNSYNPNKYQFDYKCGTVPMKNCTSHTTPTQSVDRGRIDWLNRHNVQCPGKKALAKLKFVNSGHAGHYHYEFRCCDPEDG